MDKELCNCGKKATWWYAPGYGDGGNPYSCDECVPRGCECNVYSIIDEHYMPPGGIHPDMNEVEGFDWKWVDDEKTRWCNIDHNGREYPCAEYFYSDTGFDIY